MSTLAVQPHQRMIVAVDIEGSTNHSNLAKAQLRNAMYDLLEEALLDSGITEDLREPYFDRGDGAMALVHPVDHIPLTRLLNTFIRTLSDRLAEHNAGPRQRFRLRAAIHAGEVHFDRRGTFGEDIDIAVRLLDAPEFKTRLRQTSAPLVLVVSDEIYRSVLCHGSDEIDMSTFEPLVHLHVGRVSHRGWVQVPAEAQASGKMLTDLVQSNRAG
jgi:class 3 adenylate cyclase